MFCSMVVMVKWQMREGRGGVLIDSSLQPRKVEQIRPMPVN
jgi:hypothetical protein